MTNPVILYPSNRNKYRGEIVETNAGFTVKFPQKYEKSETFKTEKQALARLISINIKNSLIHNIVHLYAGAGVMYCSDYQIIFDPIDLPIINNTVWCVKCNKYARTVCAMNKLNKETLYKNNRNKKQKIITYTPSKRLINELFNKPQNIKLNPSFINGNVFDFRRENIVL